MIVYRLTEPVDEFDGLAPLPDWLAGASPYATRWALQAILALADAADAAACTRVATREIGAWTHPTRDDIPTYSGETDRPPQTSALVTGAPY